MNNLYRIYLDQFFEKILYYTHISGRINKVFQKDVDLYSQKGSDIDFISALIISDWTASTEDGWESNFRTGMVAETTKDNYVEEIEKIHSRHLCFLYAQSFESFEKYLKDCLFDRSSRDNAIRDKAISKLPRTKRSSLSRANMPGGDKLFEILKIAGGKTFKEFSSNNNLDVTFKKLWEVLSEVRHAITHQESRIDLKKINKSAHHLAIFNSLFKSEILSDNLILVKLDYKIFRTLLKRFAEFAFQIFKLLSVEENLEWKNES